MSRTRLQTQCDRIAALLQERLHIRGRNLAHQARKVGRRLPRARRRDLALVLAAQRDAGHPKLARMTDAKATAAAAARLIAHLDAIDPREIAKDRILIALGKIAAALIVLFIALVWIAVARGLI